MKRESEFGFGFFVGHLDCDNSGQFGRINAANTNGRSIDAVAAERAGELLITYFFVGHKTFAFGTDALPLDDFFTGIAGAHERLPFLHPGSAESPANSSPFYLLKMRSGPEAASRTS